MTRETRLLREYGLIRFTILTRADGTHLGLLGHISTRVSSTQETSVREGITTTNDGRSVLLVMTNNSTRAQQLHAREEAAGWTAAGTEEPPPPPLPLHSRTRPRSDATFSSDIISDGTWAVINALYSCTRLRGPPFELIGQ